MTSSLFSFSLETISVSHDKFLFFFMRPRGPFLMKLLMRANRSNRHIPYLSEWRWQIGLLSWCAKYTQIGMTHGYSMSVPGRNPLLLVCEDPLAIGGCHECLMHPLIRIRFPTWWAELLISLPLKYLVFSIFHLNMLWLHGGPIISADLIEALRHHGGGLEYKCGRMNAICVVSTMVAS